MPTDLKSIRRKMYDLSPGSVGRLVTPASFTGTTVVVNRLASGTLSTQKFVNTWILRPDAATAAAADRERRCSAYTASSGTVTHAGTAYADTTVGTELVEIIDEEFEPFLLDDSINHGLSQRLRREDVEILATLNNTTRYTIRDLTWINQPSDIKRIAFSPNPVFTRNRHFEKHNSVSSTGALQPDSWTLAGASATMARSTTQNLRSYYSLAITRAGTDATVTQTPGLLWNGVSGDSLRGVAITLVGVVWSAVATQVRIRVTDGVDTTNSSYHTGNSTWQELTVSHTVNAAATTLAVSVRVEGSDTVAYVDELYAFEGSVSDAVRQDNYPEYDLERWGHDQSAGVIVLPSRGRGGQYILHSTRPYPAFDTTRLAAGTADNDATDAPLIPAAVAGLAHMYRGLAGQGEEYEKRYGPKAAMWERRLEPLQLAHTARKEGNMPGINFPVASLAAPAWRP